MDIEKTAIDALQTIADEWDQADIEADTCMSRAKLKAWRESGWFKSGKLAFDTIAEIDHERMLKP